MPQSEINNPQTLVPIVVPRLVVVRNNPFIKSGASGAERDTINLISGIATPTQFQEAQQLPQQKDYLLLTLKAAHKAE